MKIVVYNKTVCRRTVTVDHDKHGGFYLTVHGGWGGPIHKTYASKKGAIRAGRRYARSTGDCRRDTP